MNKSISQTLIVEQVPTHVAIIMDGNGRWASKRGLPRLAGHHAGTENLRRIIRASVEFGIKFLTIYAFSTENWNRPREEVDGLMRILEEVIDKELKELNDQGVQIRHLGRLDQLSPLLQRKVIRAVETTQQNSKLVLNVAFNYGGRDEVVQAVQHMIRDEVPAEDITPELLSRYLYTSGVPDPDLIIRTSGELRISNFLIWQAAYAEWYVTPILWPDFGKDEFRKALAEFGQRDRRYGKVTSPEYEKLMRRRALTSLLMMVLGLPGLLIGGPFYFLVAAIFLGIAAWEYVDMAHSGGFRASRPLVVGGVFIIITARAFFPVQSIAIFTFSILLAMTLHLVEYERGRDNATLDFWASVGGLVYVGWVGAYLIDLRTLPNGGWWAMLVLPIVWLADTGAYSIGARYGKHKMTPRLSPKKTWEGFWAGAISGALTGSFFAFAYSPWVLHLPVLGWTLTGDGPLHLPVWQGALFGFMIGFLTPLGDLGESMFKRQAGMKDSGNLFPGHGGVFDRIDSWLWAAVLGYYFITWFVQ